MSFGTLGFLGASTDGRIETVDVYPSERTVPITSGGSWWEDLLNATILVDKNYEAGQVGLANATAQMQAAARPAIYPTVGVPGGVAVNQGAAAGAAVGSSVNGALNFVKQNWVVVALGVGGVFLLMSSPPIRRNGVKRRRRTRK